MYEFNPENVNVELQAALRKKSFLAAKGIANNMVFNDLAVIQVHDEILPKMQFRYGAENNKIIDKELVFIGNPSLLGLYQTPRELLVLDWLVSALVCLYNNAKSISPNNRNYESVKSPLYHLGDMSPVTELTFGFPPSFSICGFIQSNAVKQLDGLHNHYDWYDSFLFSALIGMMAQHWKLWSGNISYPVPANYSCTQRKNLDDQIRKFARIRQWSSQVAEQIIECQNVALIPRYSHTSKKVIYENLRHFGKREKLDNHLWLTRSWLARDRYNRISRQQESFFDGVQGELRFELIQFLLDNLIAFQRTHELKVPYCESCQND
ncbi:hypothetical protein [Acinetobacter phage vB_AbaS_TCUP2199]|nr:hypothetical protein [Acinetobacter phage vB_AbaS_TCUP2199]